MCYLNRHSTRCSTHSASSLSRRTPPASPATRLRNATHDWITSEAGDLDIACCWHVPERVRAADKGWDELWLEKYMRRYLNKLDRRIYKAAHKNRGMRITRFITLEHGAGVGWHAHGLIGTPEHMDQPSMCAAIEQLWRQHTGVYEENRRFEQRCVWVEPKHADYLGYSLKQSINVTEQPIGGLRGIVDLHNTYLPQRERR
jgi:hypothetical protein